MDEDTKDRLMNYLGEQNLSYKRDFTTYEDLGKLKDKLVENGEWANFYDYAQETWDRDETAGIDEEDAADSKTSFTNWLFRPESCKTVAEWLRGEPQESMIGRVTKDTIIIGR